MQAFQLLNFETIFVSNTWRHTYDLLPSLMVEVCLVLAPDVNFFLN